MAPLQLTLKGSRWRASDDMRKGRPLVCLGWDSTTDRVVFRGRGLRRFTAESLSGHTRERRSATTSDSRRSLEGRP